MDEKIAFHPWILRLFLWRARSVPYNCQSPTRTTTARRQAEILIWKRAKWTQEKWRAICSFTSMKCNSDVLQQRVTKCTLCAFLFINIQNYSTKCILQFSLVYAYSHISSYAKLHTHKSPIHIYPYHISIRVAYIDFCTHFNLCRLFCNWFVRNCILWFRRSGQISSCLGWSMTCFFTKFEREQSFFSFSGKIMRYPSSPWEKLSASWRYSEEYPCTHEADFYSQIQLPQLNTITRKPTHSL